MSDDNTHAPIGHELTPSMHVVSDATRRAAAWHAQAAAADPDEARMFLAMLGLVGT